MATFPNVLLEYPLEFAGSADNQDVIQDSMRVKDHSHPPNSLDLQTSVGRAVNRDVGRDITTLHVQPLHRFH